MGPTGNDIHVIQIHPTRRCNLRCRHCYSSSGPEHAAELPIGALERFLEDAAEEGYNAIGVSGGEPLTYRPLPRMLATAQRLGFVTSVTTNGLLLDRRRVAALAPHLSLLALSIDGVPASHDRMRGMTGAFARMQGRLRHVREAGLPLGFIFTLTLNNLHELEWVTEFALAEGAQLLQIHPLESVGRATDYELLPPDDLELAYAFLEVSRLQERFAGRITLQLDVADRSLIAREPERAFAVSSPIAGAVMEQPLAKLVSPLVLQDDGWVVPIQHGFSTLQAIAHLHQGSFRDQASWWKRTRYDDFLAHSRRVWEHLRAAPPHLPFTNWYAATTQASVVGRPLTRSTLPARVPSLA